MRYFHVAYQTRGAVGFRTFSSEKFPNMNAIADAAGVSHDNLVVTGIHEFRSIDDFEAFTGIVDAPLGTPAQEADNAQPE